MTEKQYTLEWESEEICQVAYDGNYIGTDEVVDRLNGLTAKNKVLCKEIERLRTQNKDLLYSNANNMELLKKENEWLKKENKELQGKYDKQLWIYNGLGCEYDGLKEENEQLKKTINELRDMDKEKDIEIEHINNIYKEFGFKGIIEYAKDKLQEYGAVKEIEKGLWLLATGGWSDNEFWLDCLLNWNFMYAKGHYRATTSGGGYYYTETPYKDIEIKKRQIKG